MSGENTGDNRYNFWSSFNAQPKSRYKFILRFGDNMLFKSENNINLSNISTNLKDFQDLKSIPNSAWLVKSVSRPVFTTTAASKDKFYLPDGRVFGIAAIGPNDYGFSEMSIRFVNVGSHFFHPKEMPKDLDYVLARLITESGYSYDEVTRTKKGVNFSGTAYSQTIASDPDQPSIAPTVTNNSRRNSRMSIGEAQKATSDTTKVDTFRDANQKLFEPLEIIDLSTDFLPDYDIATFKDTRENTYIPEFANPLSKYDVYVEGSKTGAVISPLRDARVYPLGKWVIKNPLITQISFGGENSYENDNQFLEYEIKLGFEWAKYESYINLDPAAKYNNIY